MPLLEVEGLRVRIGSVDILRDVSLTVEAGESVALVGPNGAGKTTTLRALSGLIPGRASTRLQFDGTGMTRTPHACVRAGLAHVPENRRIFKAMTVRDNLRLACVGAGRPFSEEKVSQLLELFPRLRERYRLKASGLSGGEQQMLAVARGLLVDPKLLMVDELSLGLSPIAAAEILALLVEACTIRGTALLLVDQNVRSLAGVCERMYMMREGRTTEVAQGTEELDAVATSLYFT